MDNDRRLQSELRYALDEVLPPAPWLQATVAEDLRRRRSTGSMDRGLGTSSRRRVELPRNAMRLAAGALAIVLAVAAVAAFLAIRQVMSRPVPAGSGSKIVPDKMVSPTVGWAAGPGHAVLRTTDGGVHWTEMHPVPSPGFETSQFFLDANHAWITDTPGSQAGGWCCGAPGDTLRPSTTYQLRTFRTADGGQTWQQGTALSAQTIPGYYGGLEPDLFFVDPTHGWLLLRNAQAIYSTSDGGLHWGSPSANPAGTGPECTADHVSFATASTGWLTEDCTATESLWVTRDGGATWQVQTLPVSGGPLLDVPVFFDPQHGQLLVVEYPGSSSPTQLLVVTSDGGATWSTRSLPLSDKLHFQVDFADPSHGWVIAGHALYSTDDGGVTWVPMQTNLVLQAPEGPITDLMFVDDKNGFAVRAPSCLGSPSCTQGPSEFLKTTDGGHTWTVVWRG